MDFSLNTLPIPRPIRLPQNVQCTNVDTDVKKTNAEGKQYRNRELQKFVYLPAPLASLTLRILSTYFTINVIFNKYV